LGDKNLFRDQGQILIHSNSIKYSAEYGIVVDSGQRETPEEIPHAGPVRNLRELNQARLAPGVTVTNNVVAFNGAGGILFSGEVNTGTEQLASVPFGRIVNNTVYGGGTNDIGIRVENNAGPTLLNNIVAGLQTGISVDASSRSNTVIAGPCTRTTA